jgi:hypothetical protein
MGYILENMEFLYVEDSLPANITSYPFLVAVKADFSILPLGNPKLERNKIFIHYNRELKHLVNFRLIFRFSYI